MKSIVDKLSSRLNAIENTSGGSSNGLTKDEVKQLIKDTCIERIYEFPDFQFTNDQKTFGIPFASIDNDTNLPKKYTEATISFWAQDTEKSSPSYYLINVSMRTDGRNKAIIFKSGTELQDKELKIYIGKKATFTNSKEETMYFSSLKITNEYLSENGITNVTNIRVKTNGMDLQDDYDIDLSSIKLTQSNGYSQAIILG